MVLHEKDGTDRGSARFDVGLKGEFRGLRRLGTLAAALVLLGACSTDRAFWRSAPDGSAGRPETAAVEEPATRLELVRETQRLLSRLGYHPGAADGIEGPKTQAAIRQFQADSGYSADGQISPDLVDRLEVTLLDQNTPTEQNEHGEPGLPQYQAGTTYVYSDGRIETVTGVDGERVRWQTNRGAIFTTYRNFALPWAFWQSTSGGGWRSLTVDPHALWPLSPGNEVSFLARTTVRDSARNPKPGQSQETWHCSVAGSDRISVVAGWFDTVKVVCERTLPEPAPRLIRIWHYAPSIGHYVRLNDVYDAMELDRHVELVAIRPSSYGWPPVARAGLSQAMQYALEQGSAGEETVWSSSGVEVRVTIKPVAKYTRGDGKTCRTYVQTWDLADGKQRYPGAACRNPSGKWQIPGLEDSAALSDRANRGFS